MFEDLILEIILNMARHYDERLPYKIKEDAPQQCHQQNERSIDQYAESKDLEKITLKIHAPEGFMNQNIINDEVNGMTNQLGRNDLKNIGDDDEKCSQYQMPLVFEEIFIEITEFFHRCYEAFVLPLAGVCKNIILQKINLIVKIFSTQNSVDSP